MADATDAPGEYVDGDRSQEDKVDEILRLERDMEEMLSLETGSVDVSDEAARTVATNTTK